MMESDDLNLLYHASLEFGENWLRPLAEWAAELFPEMDAAERGEISVYIEHTRGEIENYVAEHCPAAGGSVKRWIHEQYPWMDEDNVSRGYSQGMYYAWHG